MKPLAKKKSEVPNALSDPEKFTPPSIRKLCTDGRGTKKKQKCAYRWNEMRRVPQDTTRSKCGHRSATVVYYQNVNIFHE